MTHNCARNLGANLAAMALGGNMASDAGTPVFTIHTALQDIAKDCGDIVAISRFFKTPAYPPGSGPDFVNAALLLSTRLEPAELLSSLHAIEARHGRLRAARWGSRTLDLDLLAVGDRVLPDSATVSAWMSLSPERQGREVPDGLLLPHPRLQDRAFVLIPLAEILPGWRHPITLRSVTEMVAALPAAEKAAICPI